MTRQDEPRKPWRERLPAADVAGLEQAAVLAIAADGRSSILDPYRRLRIARSAISALLDGGVRPKACEPPPMRDFFDQAREAARGWRERNPR